MFPWKELGLLVFGWLLGVLNTIVADAVRTRCKKRKVAAGLRNELDQLRKQLAILVFTLSVFFGALDADQLRWMRTTLAECGEVPESDELLRHLAEVEGREDEAANAAAALRSPDPFPGKHLAKLQLPFLSANLHAIPNYEPSTQKSLLHTLAQASIMNEKIAETNELPRSTFSSDVTDLNRGRIRQNLETMYKYLLERSRYLADFIGQVRIV